MTKVPPHPPITVTAKTGRIAGIVLLVAAVLVIMAMAHHPSGLEPGDTRIGMTLGGFIHAAMIVLLGANLWGLTIFSIRQSLGGWVLAGIVAYGISFVGNLIAGLVNGFVVPAVAMQVDHAESGDLFILLWQINQAAAQLGVYAASGAFVFWSISLLRQKKAEDLVIGGLGLIAAFVPSAALYTEVIALNVDGAFLVYGVQAAWTGLVGLEMLRQKL